MALMDDTLKGRKVLIVGNVNDERRSEGFVYIQDFSRSDRALQAFKKLGLFWGIALLSILIPVFHFVTVPLFFFLGLFFAFRSYKAEGKVLGGETFCPHCQYPVKIKPTELLWPLSEICQNCTRVIRIERKEVV